MRETAFTDVYEIPIPVDWNEEHVKSFVENGGRFVIFQYTITFIVSFRLFSKIKLIPADESIEQKASTYNLISMVFGWWGLGGPFTVAETMKVNNKGGIEITKDVVEAINLDQYSIDLMRHIVSVRVNETRYKFLKPNPSDLKAFRKAGRKLFHDHSGIENIWVANFIDTEEPYYVLVIEMLSEEQRLDRDLVQKALLKFFFKHTRIEIHRMDTFPLHNELKELGVLLNQDL